MNSRFSFERIYKVMDTLTLEEMLEKGYELRALHPEWGELIPKRGRDEILWMIGETSEVADIIKKRGDDRIMNEPEVRDHFVEEMCDVLMYYTHIMQCYQISPEELTEKYRSKHARNLTRWPVKK